MKQIKQYFKKKKQLVPQFVYALTALVLTLAPFNYGLQVQNTKAGNGTQLTVYKYLDENKNSEHDGSDTVVPGWEFTMVNEDTGESVTKTTNDQGFVVFTWNPGDTYTISENLDTGWTHSYVASHGHSLPAGFGEIMNPKGTRWAYIGNGYVTYNSGECIPEFDYVVYFGNKYDGNDDPGDDPYCELTLEKEVAENTATPGGELNYTLTLTNTGTAYCTGGGVELRDYIPDGLSFVSASPELDKNKSAYIQWNFGEVPAGEVNIGTATFLVDEDIECGSEITNKAKFWSDQTDWGEYVYETVNVNCQSEPECGDDNLDIGEECDDGNLVNGDGCDDQCNTETPESYCGDGIVDAGEQCDDGNQISGDGCNANCLTEGDNLCPIPTDVVLVMDRSQSMEDDTLPGGPVQPMQDSKDAAKYFVSLMDNTKDQVGLVSYSTTATLDHHLTTDFNSINSSIDAMTPYGWTNIGMAVDLATEEIITNGREGVLPIMIVMTDGNPNVDEQGNVPNEPGAQSYALAEAQIAKDLGYKIYTIGLGDAVKADFLKDLASSVDNYYFAPTSGDLEYIYEQIAYDICEYASISGCKYSDENNNQVIDNEEVLVEGWEIVLSGDSLAEDLTTTTENGCYSFYGLEPGTYLVSEGVNAGSEPFFQTYPNNPDTYSVTVTWEEYVDGYDFANYFPYCGNNIVDEGEECDDGNLVNGDGCSDQCNTEVPESYCGDGIVDAGEQCDDGNQVSGDGCDEYCQAEEEFGSILGCKYDDVNDNGVIEDGEETLSGINIILTKPDQTEVMTTTNDNGCYEFTNLPFGEYQVREIEPLDWHKTYPTADYHAVIVDGVDPVTDIDFANYHEQTTEPYCGDGMLNQDSEQCDGSDGVGEHQQCSNDCLLEDLTYCGDGVKQSPNGEGVNEECDGTDGVNDSNYQCSTQCVLECVSNCGGGGGPVNPVLTIEKTALQEYTNQDGIVDYTISVKNVGSATGLNLVITDTLPTGLEYYATTTTGVWELGDIAFNETKTVSYQVLFADVTVGNYVNTAKAEVDNGSSVEDTATVEVRIPTVYSEEYEPLLAVEKNVNMTFTNPGGEIVYTVTVTNITTDNVTAKNVTLLDRLPKEFYFKTNQADVNSWQLGDLTPGESKTISYDVIVKSDTKTGTYKNLAIARADNAPEVSAVADLEVRDVTTFGYELPDTNGSMNSILTMILGLLTLSAGYLVVQLKKEDSLV